MNRIMDNKSDAVETVHVDFDKLLTEIDINELFDADMLTQLVQAERDLFGQADFSGNN